MLAIPSRVIATCFALAGFAAAAATGLAAGNSTTTILWRCCLVMLAAYVVGRLVGSVAQRTVEDHIRRYKRQHPIPEEAGTTTDASGHGDATDRTVTSM